MPRALLLLSLALCGWSACTTTERPHRQGAVKPRPDSPDEALRWRRLAWRDERGAIAPGALEQARAQREAMLAAQPLGGGVGRFGWTERGPFNVGGRTRALLVHPTRSNELWAGAVGGGIWRSLDRGVTWTPVNDRMSNLAVCSLAFAPSNPAVIYAGTGEGYFNGDALQGNGIYKSSDGGANWTRLPSTVTFDNVCRIAVAPLDPNLVLISKRYGGIYRSTDGGASWTQRRSAQGSFQVLFDPNDANKLVGHLIDYDFSTSTWFHRVAYSTDAGLTWSNASAGLTRIDGFGSRIELAYARSQPGTVYASVGQNGGELWRSTDGGATWTLRGSGTGVGWYYNALWCDPTDANFVLVGSYHIYKSLNGGATFTQISDGYILTTQPHPDVHLFVPDAGFDGATNRRVYATTDGGVHVADDIRTASRTAGWRVLQNSYRATQFYGAAGDGTSGRIVGGTQDNGTLRLEATASNAALTFGGDGGFCAIDWTNPSYLYGEYVNLQIHRSSNGGASASYIYSGIGDAGNNANFIAPFILDPNNSQRLLAGGRQLWRSNNVRAATPTWVSIKPDHGDNISAIAVARGNANLVFVGHNDGKLYKSTDATAATPTWTAIDDNAAANPLPNRYLTRIVVDPSNTNRVYACFGGFSTDNLWRSNDAGATWSDVTGSGLGSLPSVPIRGLAVHPSRPGFLYAGTEIGLFTSENDGTAWLPINQGPADASIDEVVFLHNSTKLLIATHGRGLWTSDVQLPSATNFGAGCTGSLGVHTLRSDPNLPPRIGEPTALVATGVPAGSVATFLIGASNTTWSGTPLPLGLTFLGLTGCSLWNSIDVSVTLPTTAQGARLTLTLPPSQGLLGSHVYATTLALDPTANAGGMTTGNGVDLTIGN